MSTQISHRIPKFTPFTRSQYSAYSIISAAAVSRRPPAVRISGRSSPFCTFSCTKQQQQQPRSTTTTTTLAPFRSLSPSSPTANPAKHTTTISPSKINNNPPSSNFSSTSTSSSSLLHSSSNNHRNNSSNRIISDRAALISRHFSSSPTKSTPSTNPTTMSYTVRNVGQPNTLDYRAYIEKDGVPISPFHDIPLYANEQQTVLNMVVEIPRWSNAKQEVRRLH